MEKITREISEFNLDDYIAVHETKGRFVFVKQSDGVAIKVTTDVDRAVAFVQGFGEGFQFGKEWAY